MMNRLPFVRTLVFAALVAAFFAAVQAGAEDGPFAGLPVVGEATPSQDGQKFSFAILGDKTSGGEGKWPIYDRAVDGINLLEPDFVITVGDQIPGHMQEESQWDAEWVEYLEHARRLDMPLLLIPGNHDISNVECYKLWKEDLGPTYYAFDYKGCHFLALNTEEERFDGRGPIWQAMMSFAEKDLAEHADSRHTFVFFHKPMWDDPRYEDTWARLERALSGRRYTVVAGHEHYLMTERREGNLIMIQSATGGGITPCNAKAYGTFHSYGYVTVDGGAVTYAVVEPEGGVWPVDVAPASLRKAIGHGVLKLDAEPVEDFAAPMVTVRAKMTFNNVLDAPISVEVTVGRLAACGWAPVLEGTDNIEYVDGKLTLTEELEPTAEVVRAVTFRVPQECLDFPPPVSWRVDYGGEGIPNEGNPMVYENFVPLYPAACLRAVPEWQLVGPFPIGAIDKSYLPDDPATANTNFFKRFGPEDGYDAAREYAGGLTWFPAKSQGRGLLNFNGLMGTLDHSLGYALCGVHSPQEQLVHAAICSDNYHQVILNGDLLDEGQDFGAPSGFTYAPLHLNAGWNTLIVKLFNNPGDWFLRVLVADPESNLRFASTPGE